MQTLSSSVGKLSVGVSAVSVSVKSGLTGLMNLATQGGGDSSNKTEIHCVGFNQDYTSIGIGTKIGYKMYSLSCLDRLEEICDNPNEETCIMERLFSSSLVALVSMSSPRKLKVHHFKKCTEICAYCYPNTILTVKLNRSRLIVCLEESLYIHNIKDMKVLHIIRDTPPNPYGLCSLSTSNENCYLAYPGSNCIGQVQIFDALNLQAKTMIPAHDSVLAALAFNESGTKIATASEKGTVIRVFQVCDGAKLYELRRGMKRCATIYSLSFSSNSMYLVCSSSTETVHIFKLEEAKDVQPLVPDEQSGLMGWMTKAVSASASYLPTPVTDMLSQERAFATISVDLQGHRSTCAVLIHQGQLKVLVTSTQGILYVYKIDTETGESGMLKQHRLSANQGEGTGSSSSSVEISAHSTNYPGGAQKTESSSPETEKMNEMAAACESPPKDILKLDDVKEYPPMGAQ